MADRRRRKETRAAEILEAAIAEFTEHGYTGARIARIAQRAGAAKGTVYLYYATKGELFEAMVREVISPVISDLGRTLDDWRGSWADLLRHLIGHLYQQLVDDPTRRGIMRILIAEGARFPELPRFYHREVIARAQGLVGEILRRGVAAGEFRDSPIVAEPRVVIGPAFLAAVWRMVFEPVAPLDTTHYALAHADLVLHGLIAPERPQP